MVIFSKVYSSNIAIYKIQNVKIQNINYYYFVFCII